MLLHVYSKTKGSSRYFDAYDKGSLCINRKLDMDDRTLSFTARTSDVFKYGIELEGYIQLSRASNNDEDKFDLYKDEYVISEINMDSSGKAEIVARMNVEDLEGKMYHYKLILSKDIYNTIKGIVEDNNDGWYVPQQEETGTYVKRMEYADISKYDILRDFQSIYSLEYIIHSKTKSVDFVIGKRGVDRLATFIDDFNLKKLSVDTSTYDLYTELEAYGYEGLTFESINSGNDYKKYITNYTYTTKKKRYIWNAPEYTEDYDLLIHAYQKLGDMAVPYKSYSADILDLYSMVRHSNQYDRYEYDLGDTVRIMDSATQTYERFRIVEMTIYPNAPHKNSVILANKTMRLTDLLSQSKY